MESRTIICPHCNEKIDIDLMLQNIQKLELSIGIKVRKPKAEKEKSRKKEN